MISTSCRCGCAGLSLEQAIRIMESITRPISECTKSDEKPRTAAGTSLLMDHQRGLRAAFPMLALINRRGQACVHKVCRQHVPDRGPADAPRNLLKYAAGIYCNIAYVVDGLCRARRGFFSLIAPPRNACSTQTPLANGRRKRPLRPKGTLLAKVERCSVTTNPTTNAPDGARRVQNRTREPSERMTTID